MPRRSGRIFGEDFGEDFRGREAGKKAGIPLPEQEQKTFTNFIR